MASIGTVTITVTGNVKPFASAISRAEGRLLAFQRRVNGLLRTINAAMRKATMLFLLFGAVAAGVSAKIATEFGKSMTKIETLVGVNRDQVQAWRKDILKLAPAVGRGPRELADAMFAVTSAGQRGKAALNILEQAAKASAVGLGDTREVALAATAAVNAFGSSGLSAKRAVEIMVATVREGNLEASELAGSLGRVIGIARVAGVTFAEVGAFIATMTRQGVDAREAVTSLRNVLKLAVKPTNQQKEALKELGTSAEAVRESIQRRGLRATLADLVSKLDDNREAVSRAVGRLRALVGVYGTAATQGETYAQVLDSINESQGILEQAFERFKETPAATFEELKARVLALAVSIGDSLAPAISDLVASLEPVIKLVKALAEAWAALPQLIQQVTVAFTGAVAITTTLTLVLGGLANAVRSLTPAIVALHASLGPVGLALAGLGVVLGTALPFALRAFSKETDDATESVKDFTASLETMDEESREAALESVERRIDELQDISDRIDAAIRDAQRRPTGRTDISAFGLSEGRKMAGVEQLQADLDTIQGRIDNLKRQRVRIKASLETEGDGDDIFGDAAGNITETQEAINKFADSMALARFELNQFGDNEKFLEERVDSLGRFMRTLVERQQELRRAIQQGGDDTEKLQAELARIENILPGVTDAYREATDRLEDFNRGLEFQEERLRRNKRLQQDVQQIIQRGRTEREAILENLHKVNKAFALGVISVSEYAQAFSMLMRQWKQTSRSFLLRQEIFRQVGQIVEDASNSFADALFDLGAGAKNLKEAFKDMVEGILRQISRLVARIFFLKTLKPILEDLFNIESEGGGVSGGFLQSLLQAAAGAATGGGSVGAGETLNPAAGLGGGPTFAQHGGRIPTGGLGIVGEVGPELVKGPAFVSPNARQGPRMVINNENNFNVSSIDSRDVSRFFDENAARIAKQVTRVNAMSDSFNQAMQQRRSL